METGEVTEDIPLHITVEMKSTMPEAGCSSSDSVRVIKKESFPGIIGSAPPETHQSSAGSLPSNKNGSSNPKDVPKSGKNNPRGSPVLFTYLKTTQEENEKLGKWMIIFIEVVVCFLFLGGLIANLTGHLFQKNHVIWVLEPWKWCVLVLVIVGSRRITGWMMDAVVLLIKRTFAVHLIEKISLLMKYNVSYSYYIYSLGKSVRVVLWFGSVLLTWFFMFKSSGVKRSKLDSHVLKYIMRSLATFVIGGFLWVLKTLLVNALSSPFQATRLFDRFRESLIDQYILHVFFAKPWTEEFDKWIERNHLPQYDCIAAGGKVKVINWLKKIETEKISAWTMKELIEVIRSTQLSSNTEELEDLAKKEQDMNILFEKTYAVSEQIFSDYGGRIGKSELQILFNEEAPDVVQHINGGEEVACEEDIMLWRQALRKWLADAVVERRSLAQSLENTERTIKELNKLVSVTVLIMLFILWLIMLGILTTEVLVAILTQFVALAFIFGDTGKTVFQGIVFVFVMHPIDIGDCCLINGEEMVVERIDLLSSVFRKNWMDKIIFPNSALTTSPIRKVKRVKSHVINDSVEISICASTSTEQLNHLRDEIIRFMAKSNHQDKWLRKFQFSLKEIKDQKLKIVLGVFYRKTELLSDGEIIMSRRELLVRKLKSILEMHSITCHHILLKAIDAE